MHEQDHADSDATLRVLSFNVRYDTEHDGPLAWDHRKEHVVSVLRFHRPDLVGLQEPLRHQYDYVRERLPGFEWTGVGRLDGDDDGEFGPVGVRADRLAIRESDTFWLSETPDVAGSAAWEAKYPRMVTWARVRDRTTGDEFYAFNTHFPHYDADARAKSARLLRSKVGEIAGDVPAVVTGDLNCTESSDPYELLTDGDDEGRRLYDARYRSRHGHHGPSATFNLFDGSPDKRIDYVFVTDGVAVDQHGVIADDWDGMPPSDHAAVAADVAVDPD